MVKSSKAAVVAIAAIAIVSIAIMAAISAVALGGFKLPTKHDEGMETYRTHLYEQLDLPGPAFVFDYPTNWSIASEECNPEKFYEYVTLASDSGRTIEFRFGNACVSTSFIGPSEVVAETDFSPDPYPNLERPPMLHDYEWHDMTDGEIRALSFTVRSISRPEQLGKGFGYNVGGWYYGWFQFMSLGFASQGNDTFAEDETQEIIQILSSLRQEPARTDAV